MSPSEVLEIRLLEALLANEDGLGLVELHGMGPGCLDTADRLVALGEVVRSDGPLFEISSAGRDRLVTLAAGVRRG